MGDFYTFILCFVFDQLSSVKRLEPMLFHNRCIVVLLGCRISGISRKLESERKEYVLRQNAEYPQHIFWLRNKKINFNYTIFSKGLHLASLLR